MPPDGSSESVKKNWNFRVFVLLGALILFGSIAWLVWATMKFAPSNEQDILRGLLNANTFKGRDILLTRRNSDCRTEGSVTGNITADLFVAFQEANAGSEPDPLILLDVDSTYRVLDTSNTPDQWYVSERIPVISISSIGINGREGLVCVELFANRNASFLFKLYRKTAKNWEISNEYLVWEESRPEPPEEIPESIYPEVQ